MCVCVCVCVCATWTRKSLILLALYERTVTISQTMGRKKNDDVWEQDAEQNVDWSVSG